MRRQGHAANPAPPAPWSRLIPGFAIALLTGCAGPTSVVGTVVPPAVDAGSAARPGHLDRAVVFAVPAAETPSPRTRSRAQIRETDHGFEPRTLLVKRNTEVAFVNRDRIYHNAFSPSPSMRFDVGRFGPGEKRTVLFDRVGVVQVFCELHPNSSATIVVLPDRFTTHPGADGRFHLSGLPPGVYTLTAWHPSYGEKSKTVRVPRSGGVRAMLAW